jgi:glutamine synthetase
MDASPLFRDAFGEVFVKYYLALKRTEAARFAAHLKEHAVNPADDDVTAWEHDEYFDFF